MGAGIVRRKNMSPLPVNKSFQITPTLLPPAIMCGCTDKPLFERLSDGLKFAPLSLEVRITTSSPCGVMLSVLCQMTYTDSPLAATSGEIDFLLLDRLILGMNDAPPSLEWRK